MAKATDNFHNDFPARMAYGFMTDYYPNCELNLAMQKNMTSWQYRLFLIRNGNQIRNMNSDFNNKRFGCNNCNDPSIPAQTRYLQNCTNDVCHIKEQNPRGIGLY